MTKKREGYEVRKDAEQTMDKLSEIQDTIQKVIVNQAVALESNKNFHQSFEHHVLDDNKNFATAAAYREEMSRKLSEINSWKDTLNGKFYVWASLTGVIISIVVSVVLLFLSKAFA